MGMVREAEAIEQQAKGAKPAQPAPAIAPAQPTQPQQQGSVAQDFSQQWIDYYRAQGQHAEADKIEAQVKAQKQQQVAAPAAAPSPAAPAAATNGATAQDFSQQWIQYYRSQGMHAEADKIEAQMKASKGPAGPGAPSAPVYGGQFNPGQF